MKETIILFFSTILLVVFVGCKTPDDSSTVKDTNDTNGDDTSRNEGTMQQVVKCNERDTSTRVTLVVSESGATLTVYDSLGDLIAKDKPAIQSEQNSGSGTQIVFTADGYGGKVHFAFDWAIKMTAKASFNGVLVRYADRENTHRTLTCSSKLVP